jgi:hypothetical protein
MKKIIHPPGAPLNPDEIIEAQTLQPVIMPLPPKRWMPLTGGTIITPKMVVASLALAQTTQEVYLLHALKWYYSGLNTRQIASMTRTNPRRAEEILRAAANLIGTFVRDKKFKDGDLEQIIA